MSPEWNPASLLINPSVAAALKSRREYVGFRFEGKTETLLAYIAMFHDDAIIVCDTVAYTHNLRHRWKTRYPKLREPRFMSLQQFEYRSDGLNGTVFTDECRLTQRAWNRFHTFLVYGGGVHS